MVSVTGRVVFIRNTGKLCFATLQEGLSLNDSGVRLQVMLSLAEVGEERLAAWKADVDLGDFVSVTGRVIASEAGRAVRAGRRPGSWPPRPCGRCPNLHTRAVRRGAGPAAVRRPDRTGGRPGHGPDPGAVTRSLRETLHAEGYVEVETPILQLVHGGARARPFRTHLNAFDTSMTLRIALELFLKRAVIGGVERVYEIGRTFRNEGIDSTHSAEFTMLEVYQAWGDQRSIAALIQRLIIGAADAIGSRQIQTPAGPIDLDGEWRWLGVYPGLSAAVDEEITPATDAEVLRGLADRHEVAVDPDWSAEKLIMELFGELVEPTLQQPTFVCDYPPSAQPLARPHRSDPRLIEAWDLIIGGVECGTGFSELIDPVIQRERLTAQSLAAAAGDPEAMQLDEDFLAALEFGAPPMGGLGLGLDRLLMIFTGAGIRETILFPLLKPGG